MKKFIIKRKEVNDKNIEFMIQYSVLSHQIIMSIINPEKIKQESIKPFIESLETIILNINAGEEYFTRNGSSDTKVIVNDRYITSVPDATNSDNINSLPKY